MCVVVYAYHKERKKERKGKKKKDDDDGDPYDANANAKNSPPHLISSLYSTPIKEKRHLKNPSEYPLSLSLSFLLGNGELDWGEINRSV